MKKMIMTVRWGRVATGMALAPLLWLVVTAPFTYTLWLFVASLATAIVAGALSIAGGKSTRSMADVIDGVDAEPVPIAVRATRAVSVARRPGPADRGHR